MIFCQLKELWNILEKDWLNLGASIHWIDELFPLKPSLVTWSAQSAPFLVEIELSDLSKTGGSPLTQKLQQPCKQMEEILKR